MKEQFDQIQQLLASELGQRLGMSASRVTFESVDDPGMPVEGYTTHGVRQTIQIPDEYMRAANAANAAEFLAWLLSQK